MSTIVVAAQFTKNTGEPATGLTLAEIDLYLTSVTNAGGVAAVVWDGTENPTAEVDNCGTYVRRYTSADLDTYAYFVAAEYTGATVLDADYAVGSVGLGEDTLSTAGLAAVNAEVVDTLNVDTYAEPGQGAPAATASLVAKLGYLYKAFRNQLTQTATTLSIYNDAADTVDQKSTVSDDGTTYTRGEIGTGP